MATDRLFNEYRISYDSDNVFTCFATNTDSAIEQLFDFEGDGFLFNRISEIKESKNLDGSHYDSWKTVPLPRYQVIN